MNNDIIRSLRRIDEALKDANIKSATRLTIMDLQEWGTKIMTDVPKPIYAAQLSISYPSALHVFKFQSIEDALSVKNNLTIARESSADSFAIEVDCVAATIFKLQDIQSVVMIDLIKGLETNLKNIPYSKYVDKLLQDSNAAAEEDLDTNRFGIR